MQTVPVTLKPDREARRILDSVWAELAGRPTIPVDPVRIAKALGIDVYDADLPSSVSGAIRKRPNADPVILLNRDDHPNRQRFTCAHELGHFVLRSGDPDQYEYTDYRDSLASTGHADEERFANGFAAELLMPEDVVREMHARTDGAVVEMAFRFRVSQEAMANRLKNLKLAVA
jgi:Zn-dependent peptidase ImmA (M78 family)